MASNIDSFIAGTSLPREKISEMAMSRYSWETVGDKTISIYQKSLQIRPKSFTQRFNDLGRVTFNGQFLQALLILQHSVQYIRKKFNFEIVFYTTVTILAAIILGIKSNQ